MLCSQANVSIKENHLSRQPFLFGGQKDANVRFESILRRQLLQLDIVLHYTATDELHDLIPSVLLLVSSLLSTTYIKRRPNNITIHTQAMSPRHRKPIHCTQRLQHSILAIDLMRNGTDDRPWRLFSEYEA